MLLPDHLEGSHERIHIFILHHKHRKLRIIIKLIQNRYSSQLLVTDINLEEDFNWVSGTIMKIHCAELQWKVQLETSRAKVTLITLNYLTQVVMMRMNTQFRRNCSNKTINKNY